MFIVERRHMLLRMMPIMTRHHTPRLLATTILTLMTTPLAAADPPATVESPVTETLHGQTLTDPFRWLEGDAQGNTTEAVKQWTAKQNGHTRQTLDNLPGRDAIEARLRELMTVGYIGAPAMRGDRYFNTQRNGDQNQPVLYVRDGHEGEPRVLLDVNALDPDGLTALGWWNPSPDGKTLAFGLYKSGDENTTLYLIDVDSGTWLADEITGKARSVNWMPDGQSFFYQKLADIDNPYSAQILYHRVGTHPRQDRLLFEQYKEGPLASTWGPFFSMQREGHWGLIGYYTSTSSNDLWLVNLDQWLETGDLIRVPLIEGVDANTYGQFIGDRLLLTTTVDAPNGMVWEVEPKHPERDNWSVLIAHRENMVLDGVSEAKGMLLVEYKTKARTRIERLSLDGRPMGELVLPGIGSAGVRARYDRTEAYLTYTSFNEPTSIYRIDLAALGEPADYALWARPDVPVDPDLLEVKQVSYPSKDGTPITMFIVHKKGIELDGTNPTLLNGYGGFGISMSPYFSATMFPWYEAGGVFALPNLRGGGEYGDAWHKAGTLGQKQNVFDDFIAAAEYLIDAGYTSPDKLAISGGSNGGLLVGAVMTQRPDLYRAVVCQVPLLDMLRYQDFLMAKYWVPEYGDPADPQHFNWLHTYSPYHRVVPGTEYPATLITAGENDTRVHPLHARKFAALLQRDTAGEPDERPILLWVDQDAGHGGGKPLSLRIRDVADTRIFVMWQLGMLSTNGQERQ